MSQLVKVHDWLWKKNEKIANFCAERREGWVVVDVYVCITMVSGCEIRSFYCMFYVWGLLCCSRLVLSFHSPMDTGKSAQWSHPVMGLPDVLPH